MLLLVLAGPTLSITWNDLARAVNDPALQSSFIRTCWTSVLSATIATCLAVPTAWALTQPSRWRPAGESLVDIVLAMPPMVIGVCLLLLFRQGPLRAFDDFAGISLQLPAVVIAQTVVSLALAVRLMRVAFERYPQEAIETARVAGASPAFVFRHAVLPASKAEITAAGLLAWSRAFGEFGPVLLFAGVTRFETEVLSTSIHLELSDGQLGVAAFLAISMMLVSAAVTTLIRSQNHHLAR